MPQREFDSALRAPMIQSSLPVERPALNGKIGGSTPSSGTSLIRVRLKAGRESLELAIVVRVHNPEPFSRLTTFYPIDVPDRCGLVFGCKRLKLQTPIRSTVAQCPLKAQTRDQHPHG